MDNNNSHNNNSRTAFHERLSQLHLCSTVVGGTAYQEESRHVILCSRNRN